MLYGPSIQEDSHLPKLSQRKRKPPTDNMKAYEGEAIKLKLESRRSRMKQRDALTQEGSTENVALKSHLNDTNLR